MAEQLLRVTEAAGRLGLSRQTLYAWVTKRLIAHTRIGRSVRIPEKEVRRLIRAGTVKAATDQTTLVT